MANYHDDGSSRAIWDHVHEARACLPSDLFTVGEGADADDLNALASYLANFAAPIRNDRQNQDCLHCGEELTGMMAGLFGRGGFEWGLAHGEGHCRGCGYPARAHHWIKGADGKEIASFRNLVLQYLPDAEAEASARAQQAA